MATVRISVCRAIGGMDSARVMASERAGGLFLNAVKTGNVPNWTGWPMFSKSANTCCAKISRRLLPARNLMRAFLVGIALAICCSTFATAQLDEIFKKAGEALTHRDTSGLSDDKIIAGLKQALRVSTGKAVALTGIPD